MESAGAIADLERRKMVRVRLRTDLSVTPQKYEGRTYYVFKDPVSLRYFRFKEQEKFLLDLMDGSHTLDEAQKAFEQRFRPDRLTLEDLEAFASQLLTAGLVQNENPGAGKLLYERHKKRKRSKLTQAFMNILYIKIPIYDPDRVLERMLPYLWWIFTPWFLILSVIVMVSAMGLVATHWATFIDKLPSYHQFFSFRTLIYMWIALGLVKIIHEFGHGLSCKAFGGEVHEMGLLFLCLSPCLYCNVSDAWTLPSKWKRIVISAAGIYVELIIASIATFIWWNTDSGTFINNLSMSLMVVCSVSTVIFNANPLMRFDGYYVLADWLEIPNLRERSNKYLSALAMKHCLGIEVPPEPYMTLGRKALFVFYAIASYLYRWIITFSILYFMYTFLKPYKLGAISFLLGTGAVVSMFGYPVYKLIRNVKRRGRLPDMKPVRVWISAGLAAAVLVVLAVIPFPLNVKGLAVVQVTPGSVAKVTAPQHGGIMIELKVEDGQFVEKGAELAVLYNPDIEIEITFNSLEQSALEAQLAQLASRLALGDGLDRVNANDYETTLAALRRAREHARILKERKEALTLRAPRSGRVMKLVPKEERGKFIAEGTVVCEVGDPRALRAVLLVEPSDRSLIAQDGPASIRIQGRGYNNFPGRVAEISAIEAREIPPQLSVQAGGDIPAQQDPETKAVVPQQQHFLVAVDFDPNHIDDAIHPGVMAKVKIETPPQTLLWRFRRYLSTTFNWGL